VAHSCGFCRRDRVNVAVTSWKSESRPEQYEPLGLSRITGHGSSHVHVMSECIRMAHGVCKLISSDPEAIRNSVKMLVFTTS
jgi:hypothetical protein